MLDLATVQQTLDAALPVALHAQPDWFFEPSRFIHWLGPLALLGVCLVVFAESGLVVFAFLPGDSMLFMFGMLSASGFIQVPIWISVLCLFAAAFLGDQLGYLIGRRLGPAVFSREKSRFFNPANIGRTSAFFDRHGPKAVILARFVPYLRTFVPVSAGVGKMAYGRFVTYNAIGAFLWAVCLTLLAYFLGGIPFVADYAETAILIVMILSVLPLVVEGIHAARARRRSRQDAASGPIDAVPARETTSGATID